MISASKSKLLNFNRKVREEREYWTERLSSVRGFLHLRPDQSARFDDPEKQRIQFAFPSDVLPLLASVTRNSQLLLYATLLAALKVCLYRYTGKHDIVVGSPPRRVKENSPPPANALAIVDQIDGSNSFRDVLFRVRESLLAAYSRQTYLFDQLVGYLKVEEDANAPLLDVILALEDFHGDLCRVKHNILTVIRQDGEQLAGHIEFNGRLFRKESIERLFQHWTNLLRNGLANTEVAIGRLELLTPTERAKLLPNWSDQVNEVSEECLPEIFERQVRERPQAIALVHEDHQLTYAELDARANQLAHYLRDRGAGPERLVAFCLDRTPDLVISLLAILKTGGTYLPLDPSYPAQRLNFMLSDAAAMLVITDAQQQQQFTDCAVPVLRLDLDAEQIAQQSCEPLTDVMITPANPAYVIYTSGSTGYPKGVVVTHGNVSRLLRITQSQFEFNEHDVWTFFHSCAFDFSVWEIWGAFAYGGRLVIVPYWVSRSPESFLQLLHKERVTVLNQTPSAFRQLAQADAEQVNAVELALRVVIFGGEALEASSLAIWVSRRGDEYPQLINMYGITETTVHVTYHRVTAGDVFDAGRNSVIGKPLGDLWVYVLDDELNLVPVGVRGEICVSGAGVSRGYLKQSGLTAQRFVPDFWGQTPGARIYRSGDIGCWNNEGELEYEGRADEQVKIRGYRIELGEIANLLIQHETVRDALVTLIGDHDKRLVAYVIPCPDFILNTSELQSYLKERLPSYMVPSAFVVLDSFPLTVNGKIDRCTLPEPDPERRTLESAFTTPRTQTEELLAKIWAQVLRVEQVGVHDNFFELGGHSLLATQVMLRIKETFAVELPLRELFERSTVAALAESIEAQRQVQSHAPPLVAVSRDTDLPLTHAQQRIWFLDQLQPGTALYNMPLALRLVGSLNADALGATLKTIIERHEILRTTFMQRDGLPVQRVLPKAVADEFGRLNFIDLSHLDATEQQATVRRWVNEEAIRPFDLSSGPLLRVSLLRLNPNEHVLSMTIHHIISDGWSMAVLMNEVALVYPACLSGETSPLTELDIQYGDFAVWQRQWLTDEVMESQLTYWRAQLAGAAEDVLMLPTDHQRPEVQTSHGAQHSFELSQELSRELESLAHSEGVTLFMVILAVFQTLLHRYSGQARISVGTPIANRVRRETEALIGLFVNTLVMRTDFSSDPSFHDLLKQVREVCLGAYAHQDLPFERLVDELKVERDLSRAPLFQVMCALQNTPTATLELPGLELRDELRDAVVAKFDLTLSMVESPQGLRGSFEYNTDLFERATIERMAQHFEMLLEGITSAPERRVSSLPILSVHEREQIVVEWNKTQCEFAQDKCLHELFELQVLKTPNAVAVIAKDTQMTYCELDQRASALANHLRALGVGPETVVGICTERSPEMIWGLLAILKAGGAYLPLDPSFPPERLAFMLSDSGVKTVLTQSNLLNLLQGYEGAVVPLDERDWGHIAEDFSASASGSVSDNLAYVIYTSGSTGKPKGVMVTHRNVANFFTAMDVALKCDSPGTWLALTSLSFDISVLELFWTLARGFSVVLQTEDYQPRSASKSSTNAHNRQMAFSLSYFASDEQAADGYRLLLEGAKFADQQGFTAVWTPERHFHSFGGLFPNPSVTSAAIAAITESVSIRAGSVVLPLHNPIRVAEEWAVVDRLSHGRVAISFASGWHADDFALAPENYANRKEIMLRDLEIVRRLWRGESISVRGGTGNEISLKIKPRPVQAELPIWITAAGNPETFQLAGEIGAHVLTHLVGQSVAELEQKIRLYRDAWNSHGHPAGAGYVTVMLHTFVGPELNEVKEKVRQPLCDYLKSSLDLRRNLALSSGVNPNPGGLTEEDIDALLNQAFERYFESSGLLGTSDVCLQMIDQLERIGVNEAACLIDFGVPADDVIAHLPYLKLLSEQNQRKHSVRRQSHSIPAQIKRHHVTHLQCTPSLARLIAADPDSLAALGSVKTLLLGGEILPATLAKQFQQVGVNTIYNMYGPTETTVWSAMHQLNQLNGIVPLGRPIANTSFYILDQHGQTVPIGVRGELFIGGLGVTRGYLARPGLTAEKFIADPFSGEPGARLYRTGDCARYRLDGNIEFLGRLDQQVKLGGHRIELGEIESEIREYPGVQEAAVVIREDITDDKRLVAYVVPATGAGSASLTSHTAPLKAEASGRHDSITLPNGMSVSYVSAVHAHSAYKEIFEEEVYLKHGISLEEGDCVFDVGANIGIFTLFVRQKCRDAIVYAFEPIPPTFEILRANVDRYQIKASLHECGLGEKDSEATFTFYPELPGLSGRYSNPEASKETARTLIFEHGAVPEYFKEQLARGELEEVLNERFKSQTFTCQLKTLSSFITENNIARIDLLKIDVERSELDVLNGIREEQWNRIKQIVIEVESKTVLAQITDLLGRHGYDYVVDEMLDVSRVNGSAVQVYMLYAIQRAARLIESSDGKRASSTSNSANSPRAADLKKYLSGKLPGYMIPSTFVFLAELPLTPNGKLDRRALPVPAQAEFNQESKAHYVAPRTEMEKLVASVWQSVLNIEQISVHENFFDLGGNSLIALQVHSELRKHLRRELPIIQLFRYLTLEALAEYLGQEQPVETKAFADIRAQAQRQKKAIKARVLAKLGKAIDE